MQIIHVIIICSKKIALLGSVIINLKIEKLKIFILLCFNENYLYYK